MKVFTKIIAVQLACLVLFSTFSFTVDKHYCGDFLVDIALFGKASNCDVIKKMNTSKHENCCSDQTETIKGQDELQVTSFDEIVFNPQFIVAYFLVSKPIYKIDNQCDKSIYKIFPPPKIPENLQASYQVFII